MCGALKSADHLIELLGLDSPQGLKVTLLNEATSCRIGCYNSTNDHITMLSYEAALAASKTGDPPLGIPMSRTLWQSYLVHEITHALTNDKFRPGLPHQAASEYIASVVQLATLPADERRYILHNHSDLTGFDKPHEISLSYYLLDPAKFAVNSYLHYLKPENGPEFIWSLYIHSLPDD